MTKAVTKGLLGGGVSGFELLPITVLASLFGMFAFLTLMGWWKYATHRTLFGLSTPVPTRWTFLSGLCTATIIGTTTLAYTFSGVSIVFMMLLMRGGVLIIAPLVDAVSRRRVRWFSWVALLLSLGAVVLAFAEQGGYRMTALAAVDVVAYLASYFIRLRFMSRLAKSEDSSANTRFFVEEQMVATPALTLGLAVAALAAGGGIGDELRRGFTTFFEGPYVLEGILIGLFSQGTGIFGGLILLDRRENTFCVPVNRSSSLLAGVVASYGLTLFLGQPPPSAYKLAGAALIVAAILFLSLPGLWARRRALGAAAG
jgi:drug/metabolite transporter (DMT)-like permease